MSLGPAACRALIVALAAGLCSRAAATDAPTVAVLLDQPQHAVLRSLRAELSAYGFRVSVVVRPPAPPSADVLRATALREGALAAVWLMPEPAGLDVWILDRVTGKTVLRAINITAAPQETWTDLAAMRVVELLRASFLELELPPAGGTARVEAPVPVLALVGDDHGGAPVALGAHAAPAAVWSAGGAGTAVGLRAGAGVLFGRRLAVQLSGFFPLTQLELAAPEGSAAIKLFMAELSLDVLLADAGAALLPSAGAGVGLALLSMNGTAAAPYSGRHDTATGATACAHAGLQVRLVRRLALWAHAGAGIAFPEPWVSFARRDVAGWGRPFATGAMGLQIAFE